MYSGYGGSPSRTLSTMSLSVRPVRRLTSKSITRSQSFTGVNTYDKSYRNLSVFNTPGLSRKPSRARKMFNMSTKPNPTPKVPQPERLDQVYEALKKGLQSYLQVHQMDLDSLSRQMKESKRNSRLIDELYEAYCLQRRLRDGANKMVKAYTASPGSKEARESLAEANKGYKEYTENMCVLESELENQLGEFHIKMKGLAGFARLCAGDQYELFMRYGRQRWKLRGRIEINSKQVWDSEEMVFLPLINEFLSVKVTELKSLANHVVVGSVSCETKDLFAALPQTVAVDINDLGTIKLSLEVTWNPFDKDDQGSVASTINKAPTVSKRFSTIFNQSPPDTPSLREQAFYNMLRRHEEFENGAAWSNSSESSDDSSSPQLPVGGLRNSTHDKVTHKILCMLDMIYSLVLLLLYSYHSMYLFFYLLLVKDWSVKCFLNRLGMFGPLRCGEMYALDKLLRESRVLEKIRHITKDNPQRFRQPNEVIPQLGLCQGAVLLWQQCVGQGSVYSITAESFLVTLSTAYCSILPEKASNLADTVFLSLVERVLDKRLPRRGNNRGKVILTLFQLWSYLEANSIIDMETHIAELAEEVWLVQRLASNNQDVIMQTLRCPAACSLRGEGLHAVAKLMKDSRSKVSASASSVLRSLATQPRQREQALVSCLELLEDENLDTRVCGCKALACLKAKESIDQLVYLCRTDKDEVRDAAKQALLMLGEEGKMAHRHVEISQNSIPRLFTPGSMASTAF
uniref:FAM65 N-terminal domain-containing protein n=1 Tax=Anabas testudineus TaxID=64144 RepID=A0A7N6A5R4_ANATE